MGRSFFLWFSKKGDVYTNFNMPIFCALPNFITSLSFRCWSIPVSEIHKFNRKEKKKMNNSYFRFDTFSTVQMDLFFNQTYGMVTSAVLLTHFCNVQVQLLEHYFKPPREATGFALLV